MMLTGLLTAASIAVPPIGIMIAIAATAAVFAGTASFILGINFWIKRCTKEENKTTPTDEKTLSTTARLQDEHGINVTFSNENQSDQVPLLGNTDKAELSPDDKTYDFQSSPQNNIFLSKQCI